MSAGRVPSPRAGRSVRGGVRHTLYDFVALTAETLGVRRPRRIPKALARLVAGRDLIAAAVRSARTSNERIKRELGWQPRFPSARVGVPTAIAQL